MRTNTHGRWMRRGGLVIVDLEGYGSADEIVLGELGEELEGEVGGDVNVRWLQSALNRALGAGLPLDGIAGPATRAAIRSFQQRHGLQADGIAGPKVRELLGKLLSSGTGAPAGNLLSSGTGAPARRSQLDCSTMRRIDLDEFEFDRDRLLPRHLSLIQEIARCAAESIRTGTEAVGFLVQGHADPAGPEVYNLDLGLRRARQVERALSAALNTRGLGDRFVIISRTGGEQNPRSTPGKSRRVEVTLFRLRPKPIPAPRPPQPPQPDLQCVARCNQGCEKNFKDCTARGEGTFCNGRRSECLRFCGERCTR